MEGLPPTVMIFDGAPGGGKTTTVAELNRRYGWHVVHEGATPEIHLRIAEEGLGDVSPNMRPGFDDAVVGRYYEQWKQQPGKWRHFAVSDRSPAATRVYNPRLGDEAEQQYGELMPHFAPVVFLFGPHGGELNTSDAGDEDAQKAEELGRSQGVNYTRQGFEVRAVPAGKVDARIQFIIGEVREYLTGINYHRWCFAAGVEVGQEFTSVPLERATVAAFWIGKGESTFRLGRAVELVEEVIIGMDPDHPDREVIDRPVLSSRVEVERALFELGQDKSRIDRLLHLRESVVGQREAVGRQS